MSLGSYTWAGGSEALLRFGPPTGPVVIAALPLFEEANRTRSFVVAILRALADRGIASVLPDLPGTGESLVPTEATTIFKMREAYEALTATFNGDGRPTYAAGFRGGTLLDSSALPRGRWYFAPLTGVEMLRDLSRIKQAELGKPLTDLWYFDHSLHLPDDAQDPPVEIGGNLISPDLLTELTVLQPWSATVSDLPLRTVRLDTDPKPADLHLSGPPLWRRSEPGTDPALASLLADDIAAWIATCEG